MTTIKRYWAALALAFGALGAKLAGAHVCQDELYALAACLPFFEPIRAWLTRCGEVWRGRHAKPVCRHEDGHAHPEPERCPSCKMPEPDHDKNCDLYEEFWSHLHHYAIYSTRLASLYENPRPDQVYPGCCYGRDGIDFDCQYPDEYPLHWVSNIADCPVCHGE